jgi:hypothetical protein
MANKKKKRNPKKETQSPVAELGVKQLAQRGKDLLRAGSFQQAAQCLKELLKKQENEENRQLLAEANRGRVGRLVEKGLLKEAVVLLDAMEREAPAAGPGAEFLHLQLLLRTGKIREAAALYNRRRAAFNGKEGARLEALFGAYLVSGGWEKIEELPADSAIRQHLPLAARAIAACCNRDHTAAEAALKEIPFRSPYRDVRLLIKGMLLLEDNPGEARLFFDKIDPDSPYRRIAELHGLSSAQPADIVAAFNKASSKKQEIVASFFGLDRKLVSVLTGLAESGGKPRRLYQVLAASGASFLPDALKGGLMRRVLPHFGIDIMPILHKSRQMPDIEKLRLVALAAQLDGEYAIAVEMWDDLLAHLGKSKQDNALLRALILRHQAELMQRGRDHFYPDEILEKLESSLDYDPEDKEAWQRVFEISRHMDGKKYYQLVNRAVEFFPDDAEMLLTMIEAAAEHGAYKKASRFADRLLALDPINTRAKELLVKARLAHGRKLAGQRKAELARREFEAAEATTRAARYRGRHLICLGMLSLLQKRDAEGLALIEQGRMQGASRLAALVLTAVEARLMELSGPWLRQFDQEVRQAAGDPASREEILRIAGWIKTFTGEEWLALFDCCKELATFFGQTVDMKWSLEEGLLICQGMRRAECFTPVEKLAANLLGKWPDHPELQYLRIRAKFEQGRKKVDAADSRQLRAALDAALDRKNFELADQIELLLDDVARERGRARDFNAGDDFSDELDNAFGPLLPFLNPGRKKKKKQQQPTARQLNLFDILNE